MRRYETNSLVKTVVFLSLLIYKLYYSNNDYSFSGRVLKMDYSNNSLVPDVGTRGTLPPLKLKSRLKRLKDQKYKLKDNYSDHESADQNDHFSSYNKLDVDSNFQRPPARTEFHNDTSEYSSDDQDEDTKYGHKKKDDYKHKHYYSDDVNVDGNNYNTEFSSNVEKKYNNKDGYDDNGYQDDEAMESRFVISDEKYTGLDEVENGGFGGQEADDERASSQLTIEDPDRNDIDKFFSLNKRNTMWTNNNEPDYREIALDIAMNGKLKNKKRAKRYCDFVLVYDALDDDVLHVNERKMFEFSLQKEKFDIIKTTSGSQVFVELYASFDRLCREAELVCLQMPLEGFILQAVRKGIMRRIFQSFKTDNEVDMISAPFCHSSKHVFDGIENKKTFFRSAHRAMLVRHILENKKITTAEEEKEEENEFNKTGLSALLHSGSYVDAFILHDRSEYDKEFPLKLNAKSTYNMITSSNDPRKNLHDTWLKCTKFQPLWKIRNYFGEKIGLYFAWCGILITSLWVPVFLGLIVFVFGLFTAFPSDKEVSVSGIQAWMSAAFDNDATPFFALLICLWGTVFLEFWKRKNAELAYKWDVDSFEEQEPNRPQFYGTKLVKNPITGAYEDYYPLWRKILKTMGSISVILFMVLLVLTSVVSVIVYKVVSRVDWFASHSKGEFASSFTSAILNSVSILLLGKLYKSLAYKLTNWENHQTRTQYEDALILKLFGFQFINSYASLFYIAFFRERTSTGVFRLGSNYSDSCGADNDCMSLLSIQVAVMMITKPMPKLFSDIILPVTLRVLKKICCCFKKSNNKVDTSENQLPRDTNNNNADTEYENYLHEEYRKPDLGNFTLTEYTEKVLQYGYLMLFAAAFPLAPLIALLTNIIDLRVDGRRMLWFNRRPMPQRAQDIGMWFTILTFLNYTGMITNALILALTSRYGRDLKTSTIDYIISPNMTLLDIPVNSTLSSLPLSNLTISSITSIGVEVITYKNLWIVIIFENVVLAVKFLLSYVIPDVPESVSTAQKQEKVQLEKLLSRSGLKRGPGKSITVQATNLRDDVNALLHNEGRGMAKERVRTKRLKR